jgi:hypothetical protein
MDRNPKTSTMILLMILPEFLEKVSELLLVIGSEELVLVTGHQGGQGQAFLVLP